MFALTEIEKFEQTSVGHLLSYLVRENKIDPTSYYFAQFIQDTSISEYGDEVERAASCNEANNNLVILLAALATEMMLKQHSCVDLQTRGLNNWLQLAQAELALTINLPDHQIWAEVLAGLPSLVTAVGDEQHLQDGTTQQLPSEAGGAQKEVATANGLSSPTFSSVTPFVLWQKKLYLRRFFVAERIIAHRVKNAVKIQALSLDQSITSKTTSFIDGLFPKVQLDAEPDWQKMAVLSSVTQLFSVISGGPGTGKTTTVVKLLASLVFQHQTTNTQNQTANALLIGITAPTGKAALRLENAINEELDKLDLPTNLLNALPTSASTVHRILGSRGNGEFKYTKTNPLPHDVLLIDEASMVDVSLMSKLFDALKDHCRIILIGDRKQLASVEAGNVLADFYQAHSERPMGYLVELKKSWRFGDDSAVGRLANVTNSGNLTQIQETFENPEFTSNLTWLTQPNEGLADVIEKVVEHFVYLTEALTRLSHENEKEVIKNAFDQLQTLQLLACIRRSEFGTEAINSRVHQRLIQKGVIPNNEQHYVGRPVMVTSNAYHLNLYNGDIGLQAIDPTSGLLMTYFMVGVDAYCKIHCQRLPVHESVYAMTVHKSQGSAFLHTILVLPQDEELASVVTRELVYTGLTRSRAQFTLVASLPSLATSVNQVTVRNSGLAKMIMS